MIIINSQVNEYNVCDHGNLCSNKHELTVFYKNLKVIVQFVHSSGQVEWLRSVEFRRDHHGSEKVRLDGNVPLVPRTVALVMSYSESR